MPTDIYIDDVIGAADFWDGGVSAKGVRTMLEDVPDGERVRLRINSEGGSVFEATSIVSEMRQRGGYDVLVDGLAASAASYIAVMADNVEMAEGSWFMIHNPHAFEVGDYRAMASMGEKLARHAEKYAHIYAKRTGLPYDEIRAMMDEETWISDVEAVEKGFADSVSEVAAQEHAIAACFRPGGKLAFRKEIPAIAAKVTDAQRGKAALQKLTGAA